MKDIITLARVVIDDRKNFSFQYTCTNESMYGFQVVANIIREESLQTHGEWGEFGCRNVCSARFRERGGANLILAGLRSEGAYSFRINFHDISKVVYDFS